jgi:hypothetical protein
MSICTLKLNSRVLLVNPMKQIKNLIFDKRQIFNMFYWATGLRYIHLVTRCRGGHPVGDMQTGSEPLMGHQSCRRLNSRCSVGVKNGSEDRAKHRSFAHTEMLIFDQRQIFNMFYRATGLRFIHLVTRCRGGHQLGTC